jgi:hypothetical protein
MYWVVPTFYLPMVLGEKKLIMEDKITLKIYYNQEPSTNIKSIFDNINHKKVDNIDECDFVLIANEQWCSNHSANVQWLNNIKTVFNSKKYIAFLHSDSQDILDVGNGILFRTSFLKSQSGGALSYPTFPLPLPQMQPNDVFKIGFCGYINLVHYRIDAINKLSDYSYFDYIIRDKFHYHYSKEEQEKNKEEYFYNIKQSSHQLCIRGAGNFSWRLYESLMCGRIPIILDTDYPLPCENKINWDDYVVISPNVDELNDRILRWNKNHNIIDAQNKCRWLYENYISYKGFSKYIEELLLIK